MNTLNPLAPYYSMMKVRQLLEFGELHSLVSSDSKTAYQFICYFAFLQNTLAIYCDNLELSDLKGYEGAVFVPLALSNGNQRLYLCYYTHSVFTIIESESFSFQLSESSFSAVWKEKSCLIIL